MVKQAVDGPFMTYHANNFRFWAIDPCMGKSSQGSIMLCIGAHLRMQECFRRSCSALNLSISPSYSLLSTAAASDGPQVRQKSGTHSHFLARADSQVPPPASLRARERPYEGSPPLHAAIEWGPCKNTRHPGSAAATGSPTTALSFCPQKPFSPNWYTSVTS